MSKELTREGIARSHRIWHRVYIGWRVFCVAYTAFVLTLVFAFDAKPYLLIYLALPPMWWALSVMWDRSNDRIHDSRLRTLEIKEQWR